MQTQTAQTAQTQAPAEPLEFFNVGDKVILRTIPGEGVCPIKAAEIVDRRRVHTVLEVETPAKGHRAFQLLYLTDCPYMISNCNVRRVQD